MYPCIINAKYYLPLEVAQAHIVENRYDIVKCTIVLYLWVRSNWTSSGHQLNCIIASTHASHIGSANAKYYSSLEAAKAHIDSLTYDMVERGTASLARLDLSEQLPTCIIASTHASRINYHSSTNVTCYHHCQVLLATRKGSGP